MHIFYYDILEMLRGLLLAIESLQTQILSLAVLCIIMFSEGVYFQMTLHSTIQLCPRG